MDKREILSLLSLKGIRRRTIQNVLKSNLLA
jgi:hypothetical protein